MNKIFNKFLIVVLFLLGVMFIPISKANAVITVTVYATPSTVSSSGTTKITWTSTGATSCTRTDTGAILATSDLTTGFTSNPLYTTTTFTINCTAPAYCSGTYNVTGGYCQGSTVVGSKDGTTVPGPYEGQLCSSLTKSVCDTGGWITHGCSTWLVTTNTVSCDGLSQTNCGLHSSGTPHCTWNP